MGTRKAKYNEQGISGLPNDKPVLYRIETERGRLNYAGVAKRGRVQERIGEHLGRVPGANVRIEQFSSMKDAQKKEARVIRRNRPRHNRQGK